MSSEKVERLICSCCGKYHFSVQWQGRDKGYGLCNPCVAFVSQYNDERSMAEAYGVAGVHYARHAAKYLDLPKQNKRGRNDES